MSRGEEGERNSIDVEFLPPFAGGDVRVEQPRPKHPLRLRRAYVGASPPPGVVAVGVGDHSTVDGHPWIDVEIAGFAVEAAVSSVEQIGHLRSLVDA